MPTVGEAIQGNPQDDNVSAWKQFFTRPENLATALVMATALTSEKRSGQSNISKLFESGVAGLGYRGGVQGGVRAQRQEDRTEAELVAKQAADIEAQRATTGQGAAQVDISRGQLAEQTRSAKESARLQEQANLINAAPRPLNPAEAQLMQAQAGMYGRMPQGAQPEPPPNPMQMLSDAMTLEAENAAAMGREPDYGAVVKRTMGLLKFHELTTNGQAQYDPFSGEMNFPPGVAEALGIAVDELPDVDTKVIPGAKPPPDYTISGSPLASALMAPEAMPKLTMNAMRNNPKFKDSPEPVVRKAVEVARRNADSKETLEKMSDTELQLLLDEYGPVLAPREMRNIRAEQNKRKPSSPLTEAVMKGYR